MYSKRTWWHVMSALGLILATCASVAAQNLPPPGAYPPIPNFSGVGAGLQFRESINDRFSGAQPIFPTVVGPSFANLPAEQDGAMLYCKDCKRSTPCASGGSGAWALGTRGQWSCSSGALEAGLNANGNKITSLANGTVTGDALAFGQTSGGDLLGSLPNPTVQTVLGGKAPIYAGQTGAHINTLAGAKGDGSDALNGFNVNGIFNVKAYGAKGDHVNDDAPAISAAIAAACAVSNGGTVATQVFFPPGVYNITYPIWMDCNGLRLNGAGRTSSDIWPTYWFGPAIGVFAVQNTGIPTTTSLVSGAGEAFDFTQSQTTYWLNLREYGGTTFGPLGSPSGMNLNGLSAFTIEAFVKDVTAADGDIAGSDSLPNSLTSYVSAANLGIVAGSWFAHLKTSGGSFQIFGAAAPTGSVKYVAMTYDGTTLRLYDCIPGATNCAVDASTAATGTIVQDPSEDVTVGPLLGSSWPNGGAVAGAIKGYIDSVRISNSARWTGTIATVPNGKFSSDSNTLILTNGETGTPAGASFVKAYTGASGNSGWLFPYNEIQTGAPEENDISNLAIGSNVGDGSGIILDDGHDCNFGPLLFKVSETALEVWNIAFENNFHDLNLTDEIGRCGIVNNSADNLFSYTKVLGGWAGYCFPGSGTLVHPIFQQAGSPSPSAFGLIMPSGGAPTLEVVNPFWDVENGGTGAFKAAIFGSSITNLHVSGGQLSSMSAAPAIWLDGGGTATVDGGELSSGEGSPAQIIKFTSTGNQPVVLVNPQLLGWGSAPLSTTAGLVTMTPCKGTLTLAAGAGTFSNVCVTTMSMCSARDMTTPASPVTVGVPVNGSIAVSGTGTDSILVGCH